MAKAPINCTIDEDLALWVRINKDISPSEVLQAGLEAIRDTNGKPPADERKLEREIEYMREEVRKLQREIIEATAQLSRVKTEREHEQKKHLERVFQEADLLSRTRGMR